jgi:hypothetical protein
MSFFNKPVKQPIQDEPKKALQEYFTYLETEYQWYERAAKLHNIVWIVFQGILIISSILTALIAALAHEETFKSYDWLRMLLVVLPLLGVFATTILSQIGTRDLLKLREKGRQDIRTIIDHGQTEFAAATTTERYTTIHRDLVAKMDMLDNEQTDGFFSLAPDVKSQ